MTNQTSEFNTRMYMQGDETDLVRLFNKEHSELAGFVPRTVEYWRWSCLKRPDVEEKGIHILEKETKIVGYVVVGKSGNVWELCYDSSYNAKAIVSQLFIWAEDYARSVGSSSIVLNAYNKDRVVQEVCQDMDFAESPPEPTFLSVLDLPQLISQVLQAKSDALNANDFFWFRLRNCPPWCLSSFGVRLENNQATIIEEQEHMPTPRTTIEMEMSTVVGLLFGKESFLKDAVTSKVRVRPFWKIFRVRKLFGLLETRTPWLMPRADIG